MKSNVKKITSPQSMSSYVKSVCDIMRRSNCASALQYVPELTWILFLRIIDAQEAQARENAEAIGSDFSSALVSPYRWQDWAAPFSEDTDHPKTPEGKPFGWKRQELYSKGDGKLFAFINEELLPYLHAMNDKASVGHSASSRKQKIIGSIMAAVERVRVDSETNFLDILDKIDLINLDEIDDTHFFTLSQVYEDLLLKMGEKNSDGGQFFTPREVIRAMVHSLDPQPGETIYDPCCGTGGFLAVAYEHIFRESGSALSSTEIDTLKHDTFFGREKENLVLPIALANLVLHGIDQPNIWHGNSLTKTATNSTLFEKAPSTFDLILTNPPFGGKEGKDAQKNFAFETGATQVLFLQDIMSEMSSTGRCGIVLDEGLLFRTNETAFVETKRKLVDEFDLWTIISLPGGVFSTAGTGVRTSLLFFTKGKKTEKIWYYDFSHLKIGKKTPMTLAHFGYDKDGKVLDEKLLPVNLTSQWAEEDGSADKPFPSYAKVFAERGKPEGESRYSWTVDFAARRAKAREEMQPHLEEEARIKAEIVDLKVKLKQLKDEKAKRDALKLVTDEIKEKEKLARESKAKADTIDAAVFDLKAVNPNAVSKVDLRTPQEIIQNIEKQQTIVNQSMDKLKQLLGEEGPTSSI